MIVFCLFVVKVLILIILIKLYSIYLTPSLVDNETSFVDVFLDVLVVITMHQRYDIIMTISVLETLLG